jgi:branched-chain amino acid transport system permease protein
VIAYLINIATLIAIFAILSSSMNVLLGYGGIFSAAHAVFMGLGAYAGAQIALTLTPDILVACGVAALLAALLSICLALPALRVRGEYFVAASLGLQMLATTAFAEARGLTGGMGGLTGIPRPTLLGLSLQGGAPFLAFCLAVLALAIAIIALLMRGSFGRSLMALRDNESAAQALGKNVAVLKTLATVAGCAMAGVAGALFAFHMQFVNTESFTLDQSILIVAMLIIGGVGTLSGPIIGAVALLLLPAALSFIPNLPAEYVGAIQQMIYGFLMTALMIFRPGGLTGRA